MAAAVSVVVATHDRPAALAACLASLARLEPPPGGFEVVVVDDGGAAPVDGVLAGVDDRLDVRLARRERSGGPAIARNDGARHARGRVLAFTDDDCRVDPGWLRALVAMVELGTGMAAGGTTYAGLPGNRWARASEAVEAAVDAHEDSDAAGGPVPARPGPGRPARALAAVGG